MVHAHTRTYTHTCVRRIEAWAVVAAQGDKMVDLVEKKTLLWQCT